MFNVIGSVYANEYGIDGDEDDPHDAIDEMDHDQLVKCLLCALVDTLEKVFFRADEIRELLEKERDCERQIQNAMRDYYNNRS